MKTETLTRTVGHGSQVEAVYTPVDDVMYQHNCYIEALPPALDPEEAIRYMKRIPYYNESERNLPPLRRLHAVQRIAHCVFPLPEYILTEQQFYRMICDGYFQRNPLSAAWREQMSHAFKDLKFKRGAYDLDPLITSKAAGFSILGTSGVGKTTLIESVLSLYPQVIFHTAYDGVAFDQKQLVWLKLECPHDGSPRGICTSFFHAIDHILGTRYEEKYNKRNIASTDFLMPTMAQIAGEVGLGVLVIDEIQRLRARFGADLVLDFFIQLTNDIGVPVVFVGTWKGFSLFTERFAAGRRSDGYGSVFLSNFARGEFWDDFIEKLWRFQWTNVPTPLTDTLGGVLHEESQGIADIAVKIYMLAQWRIIGEADERISANLLRAMVKEHLHAVAPMLEALRTHDEEALEAIKDIRLDPKLLDAALAEAVRRVLLSGEMATIRNETRAEKSNGEVGTLPFDQLAMQLARAGFAPDLAMKCARAACDRFAADTDMKRASAEAFRLAIEEDLEREEVMAAGEKKARTHRRKAKVVSLSGDLREIIKNAPAGMTPYQALREAGIIKSPLEFFPGE